MKALPTLRQLRYLTALAEHHHFGKAATACLATQSTLSSGLVELENILKITLVERTKRRVIMTPIGQQIAERARILLDAAENLVDLADQAHGTPLSGPLHLGIIPTIAPYILPDILPNLRQSYPQLKLHLREDLSGALVDRLSKGELDAIILALPYPTTGLENIALFDDPFVLACLPDHALTAQDRIQGPDLMNAGMVLLEEGHCLRDHSLSACSLSPSALGETILATSLFTLVQMVASGLGVTLLPQMAVDHGILNGTQLVTRPLAPPASVRTIALCWRESSLRKAEFHLLAQRIQSCQI